jgi:hypothetical protein
MKRIAQQVGAVVLGGNWRKGGGGDCMRDEWLFNCVCSVLGWRAQGELSCAIQ